MYKKPSPTLIGAFVTGAVLLLIGGLVFFGSGLLFSEKQIFVLFFNGSLKGLDVGSPVTFRGVPIGQVKKIKILVDPETGLSKMPVYIAINPKSLFSYSGTGSVSELGREAMEAMIARRGLRGQLQIQSLVT
ncbi:MAG: MCE family protein, partial [Thermodesulfatator sp.]